MFLGIFKIRYRNTIFFGPNSIDNLKGVIDSLKERGISKYLVVTGKRSYKVSGAWGHVKEVLEREGLEYFHYDRVSSNPTIEMVEEGKEIAEEGDCQAIIAIGGGSPIDVAKGIGVAVKTEEDPREIYMKGVARDSIPIIAINLTHGTGSEVDRYSVVTIPERKYKLSIGGDPIYPLYSFDDPLLTFTLNEEQTKYVTIDAFCHAFEAGTSSKVSPFSWTLSKEAISLILNYIGRALKNPRDLEARYYLMYASMIAGMSFDNSPLHIIHAMEHPISAIKPEIAHGLGLAVLLPTVIEEIYSIAPREVSSLLSPMIFKEMTPKEARERVECWLSSMKIPTSLSEIGIFEDDIDELVRLVFETPNLSYFVHCFPSRSGNIRDIVRKIYFSSI